jgi:signal transduction histidine kinase
MRIVQQVLVNVIKHAAASRLCLSATKEGGEIQIRIDDDGKGFDLATTVPGRGIRSLRTRAVALGGRLDIQAARPRNTSVRLSLPTERSNEPGA